MYLQKYARNNRKNVIVIFFKFVCPANTVKYYAFIITPALSNIPPIKYTIKRTRFAILTPPISLRTYYMDFEFLIFPSS